MTFINCIQSLTLKSNRGANIYNQGSIEVSRKDLTIRYKRFSPARILVHPEDFKQQFNGDPF